MFSCILFVHELVWSNRPCASFFVLFFLSESATLLISRNSETGQVKISVMSVMLLLGLGGKYGKFKERIVLLCAQMFNLYCFDCFDVNECFVHELLCSFCFLLVERDLLELRKLGIEQQLWEASRKGIDQPSESALANHKPASDSDTSS
jgi:hypothetical protein